MSDARWPPFALSLALCACGAEEAAEEAPPPSRAVRCEVEAGDVDPRAAQREIAARRGALAVCVAMIPERPPTPVLTLTVEADPGAEAEGGSRLRVSHALEGPGSDEAATCLDAAGRDLAEAVASPWSASAVARVRCTVPIDPPR